MVTPVTALGQANSMATYWPLGLATVVTAGVAVGSAEAWNASANNIKLITRSSRLSRGIAAGH